MQLAQDCYDKGMSKNFTLALAQINPTVGDLSGNAERHDIAHLADYTIDSVADLPALLRSL